MTDDGLFNFAILVILIVIIGLLIVIAIEFYPKEDKHIEVSGLYYISNETSVIDMGRTYSEAQDTLVHEYCHHLVHKEPEHFCGWWNND